MNLRELVKDLKLDDLQEQHRQIAEIIGLENMVNLSDEMGGITFCIPQVKSLLSQWIEKRIKEEFNGYNIRSLTRKYGISEKTVYRICKGMKNIPMEGQISLGAFSKS